MAFFNDTFCQLCERFITKEEWNKHLYSSRHLHREVNGFWPAYFPQIKLTGDECSIHECSICRESFLGDDFWKCRCVTGV